MSFYAHSALSILFVFTVTKSNKGIGGCPSARILTYQFFLCVFRCLLSKRIARSRSHSLIRARARGAQIRVGNPAPAGAREILRPPA